MNQKNIAMMAVIGGALLLSSCNIYRPYSRPEMKTAGLYRDTVSNGDTLRTSDTLSMGNLPWQEVFTDAKLQKLIEQGLNNNLDLLVAVQRVEEYKTQFKDSQLAFLPSLSFAPNGELAKVEKISPVYSYTIPLAVSWEVDLFGKLLNAKRGAKAALYQSEASRQAVRSQVIAGIANTYYTLLMLDQKLAISEQTTRNWELNVQMMKSLKDLGNVNEAAVVQSEANYYAVKASLPELRRSIRETENALSLLLGVPAQQIDRSLLYDQTLPTKLGVGVPVQMLSNRPDVKAAEMGFAAAVANTNVARASMYPSLTIGVNGGWTNSLGGAIVNPAQLVAQATASLVQPIFAKGANRARLNKAKAQQEAARLSFQKTLLTAGNEVSDALYQYKSACDMEISRADQVKALEKAVTYTTQLLRLGSATYLEVITAEQSLLSAQLSEVSDQYDRMQAVVYLYQALGGGR
ncbi:MAG: TolC family protein [Alistipes sp.]|nr:TolC family protein [Alistipes sp.]